MDEFFYFTKEVILKRSLFSLSWEINIPGNPNFEELTIRFSKCIASFECYLMNREKDDRSFVAGMVLDGIITAMVNADRCSYENIPTPRNVACLCMVFHNGVRNILDHLIKLNISIPDSVIQRMEKLTKSLFYIRKEDNGKIIKEEVNSHYRLVFGLYLDKYNGQQEVDFPKELNTDEAKKILQRGVDAKLLDDNFQPINGKMTKYQMKRFAELASLELGIKGKWKVFGSLWNIKNLGQIKDYEASFRSLKVIENLFPKEIAEKAKKK